MTIQVGTRIHSSLYGGRDGVVVAIHGVQSPETIRPLGAAGVITMGGRAYFDIVFTDGTETKQLPECILRGVQWRIYADVATPHEIAFLREYVEGMTTHRAQLAAAAKAKFDAETDALRTDARYAKLTRAGQLNGGKLVAMNLRVQFKAAFPGVKFSITSDYNSVNIRWTDGPTTAQVEAISGAYKAGHFDGMTDSYEYSRTPFAEVFGSAQYIFTTRKHSLAAMQQAAAAITDRFGCEPIKVLANGDGSGYVGHDYTDNGLTRHAVYDLLEERGR